MSKFKIQKVKRVLKLSVNGYKPAQYIVYKLTGPNVKKYFGLKKNAEAWLKWHTSNHPMTEEQLNDFYKGR